MGEIENATELSNCIQNGGDSSDDSIVIHKSQSNDVASNTCITTTIIKNNDFFENNEILEQFDDNSEVVIHKTFYVESNTTIIKNNDFLENNEILEQLQQGKIRYDVPVCVDVKNDLSNSNPDIQESREDAFSDKFKSNSSFNSTSSLFDYHIAEIMDLNPDSRKLFLNVVNRLENLENEVISIKGENKLLSDDLRTAKSKIKKLNNDLLNKIDIIYEDIYALDCRVINTEQYARRESIIISGIPDNIKQEFLEPTVLEILRSIGLRDVTSYGISACHRLFKKKNNRFPAQTIIRFTNRKIVGFCLRNRESLLNVKNTMKMNLRFYESLCSSNEEVLKECYNLKKHGVISDYYLRNGFIKLIRADNTRIIKIKHPDELYDLFSDYYDYEDVYLN